MDNIFDRGTSHFDHGRRFDDMGEKIKTNQRLAGLQHGALKPRITMEEDVKRVKKTRERTEGAAAAD